MHERDLVLFTFLTVLSLFDQVCKIVKEHNDMSLMLIAVRPEVKASSYILALLLQVLSLSVSLSLSVCVCLSLSLSHTHTHTDTLVCFVACNLIFVCCRYIPTLFWGKCGHIQSITFSKKGRFNCPTIRGKRHFIVMKDGATITYDVFQPTVPHKLGKQGHCNCFQSSNNFA